MRNILWFDAFLCDLMRMNVSFLFDIQLYVFQFKISISIFLHGVRMFNRHLCSAMFHVIPNDFVFAYVQFNRRIPLHLNWDYIATISISFKIRFDSCVWLCVCVCKIERERESVTNVYVRLVILKLNHSRSPTGLFNFCLSIKHFSLWLLGYFHRTKGIIPEWYGKHYIWSRKLNIKWNE